MKNLLLTFLFTIGGYVYGQTGDFVFTIQTNNPGTSDNTSFTIPATGGGYNYEIFWGTTHYTGITGSFTIPFNSSGTYQVRIKGMFPHINFKADLDDKLKLLSIDQWGSAIGWTSFNSAFYGCANLVIKATDKPDLTNVTDLSRMFYGCSSITTITNNVPSEWQVQNITSMAFLFYGCTKFNQDIGYWNTSAVKDMQYMFYGCEAFNQNINSWNKSAVTNMEGMFSGAKNFLQDISGWKMDAVTNMGNMFSNCINFNPDVTNWKMDKVNNTSTMFFNCPKFNQNIGNWNTGAVNNMANMFVNCKSFNQDISSWNTEKVMDMSKMFYGCTSFNKNIGQWKTTSVSNMKNMFFNCINFNQDIGGWNTANVYDMSYMFDSCKVFNQDISSWNTANVKNMSFMFSACTSFNKNIGKWNTSAVSNMSYLFSGCSNFNQDISSWNTANVKDMSFMFNYCTPFNQNIGKWNTGSVINMSNLLVGCLYFNQDISSWNTGNVTDMSFIFFNCSAFNQPIEKWNTSSVNNMAFMFRGGINFNQNIGNWNTEKVKNMGGMFYNCNNFNQDIGSWNTRAVTDMSNMFFRCYRFNKNISKWATGAVGNMSFMFQECGDFNQDLSSWKMDLVTNMSYMLRNCTSFNQDISKWNIVKVLNMEGMLDSCGMNSNNYDATLIGWQSAAHNSTVSLGASGLRYCAAAIQHDLLTNTSHWIISGDANLNTATRPTLVNDLDIKTSNIVSCIDPSSGFMQFLNAPFAAPLKYMAINPNGNVGFGFGVTAANNNPQINNHVISDNGINTTALGNRMYTVVDAIGGHYPSGMTVRIYYDDADSIAATANLDQNNTGPLAGKWFEFVGNNHGDNVAAIIAGQTSDSIVGATFLVPSARGIENGFNYVEFSAISNFGTFGFLAARTSKELPAINSFIAIPADCAVTLSWQIDHEQNVSYYAVETSHNGIDFIPVAKIETKNSPVGVLYKYDYETGRAITNFRIKLVGKDSSFAYSTILSATTYCLNNRVIVTPNPASDVVNIGGVATGSIIRLYDVRGHKLIEQKTTGPNETINISRYPKGIYLLNIQATNGLVRTIKLVRL